MSSDIANIDNSGRDFVAGEFDLKLLETEPGHSSHWLVAGALALQNGDIGLAVERLRQAVTIAPDDATCHQSLGVAYLVAARYPEAIGSFERALQLHCSDSTRDHLARAYLDAGRFTALLALYAGVQPPYSFSTTLRLAQAYRSTGNYPMAIEKLHEALAARPEAPAVHAYLGEILFESGRYAESVAAIERAVLYEPSNAGWHNNLGVSQNWCGQTADGVHSFRNAVRLQPENEEACSNLLLGLHYAGGVSPETIYQAHRNWGARAKITNRLVRPNRLGDREGKIHVGVVSQDFHGHSVASFFEPLLRWAGTSNLALTCYSHTRRVDHVTVRLRQLCPAWREIGSLTDGQAADAIDADGIDVLIDLAGHTGGNRLSLFSYGAAPVQATYLAYPDTTGHPAIRYRFTDSRADPVSMTEELHTEELVRIDPSFLCYQPPLDAPAVGDLPILRTGVLTLGCFNHLPKLSDQTLSLWSRILSELPNSRLLLKCRSFRDAAVVASVMRRLDSFGIAPDRARLHAFTCDFGEHLDLYNSVDIGLDPYPYHGTTTTCEALWMGIPVVTLAGRTHVSRVGASLMPLVGLEELVTESEDDYVNAVCRLGEDLGELAEIRRTLRSRMSASFLTDGRSFAERFTAACERIAPR